METSMTHTNEVGREELYNDSSYARVQGHGVGRFLSNNGNSDGDGNSDSKLSHGNSDSKLSHSDADSDSTPPVACRLAANSFTATNSFTPTSRSRIALPNAASSTFRPKGVLHLDRMTPDGHWPLVT